MDMALEMWAMLTACILLLDREARAACTMAEFPCRNKECISLDQYCDGNRDCSDGSDEPSGCSPCNRTYYGKVGATYRIRIQKPRRGHLPHFCQLTFMASGDMYGDLVTISIERFSLGRFSSHTADGCPDGYMQIEELSRPSNTGYWCGVSFGYNVYYSETSSVSIMLRVFNLTNDVNINPATISPQDNILLQIAYRFISKEKAVLRYGVPYSLSYLGEDIPGTFCDRYYTNCDKKNCKILSPNYPGMYPRNLTCHYHIEQTKVPDGKVALVRVRQRNPHLIYIKDRNAPHILKENRFVLGDNCHVLHDYLMIYDGNSTDDPLLLKVCKGGPLSSITASGPNLLIAFHASSYDFPFQDSPRRRIFGFQLETEIVLVGRESTAYVRRSSASQMSALYPAVPVSAPYSCQWEVSSQGQRSGYIQAPAHSLLANTTCLWRLLASPSEVVWLYFLHYRHVKHEEMPPPSQCPNTLTIIDGISTQNGTMLGQFCKRDKFPRVCTGVHTPGAAGSTAPCPPLESYVSVTSILTLTLRYAAGTTPSHVEFLARYEFVDQRQWGEPTLEKSSCNREFGLRPDRLFASPRNVFLFGRGGARNLECVYTFRGAPNQRITLKILRSRMGNLCKTLFVEASQRYECSHGGADTMPSILIKEKLWTDIHLSRGCLCNMSTTQPFSVTSYTSEMTLTFVVPSMTPSEDYDDYFFEGEYDIFDANEILLCDEDDRIHTGRYGNFTLGYRSRSDPCLQLPRIINAQDGAFIYLKAAGFTATETNCGVSSRINVFAVGESMPIASVCPDSKSQASVFSNGWEDDSFGYKSNYYSRNYNRRHSNGTTIISSYFGSYREKQSFLDLGASRDLIVEYSGNYSGEYLLNWIGVWKPLRMGPISSAGADQCPHRCPEIQACLPPELWCNGDVQCPSGIDEGASACGILAALPWVSLGVGVTLILSLLGLLAAVMHHRKKTQASKETYEVATVQNNGLKSNSVSTTEDLLILEDKESSW